MKRAKGLIIGVAVFCLGVFFVAPTVFAQEVAEVPVPAFLSTLNVTYTVDPQGVTKVRYEVRLRNTTSVQYATQYALQVNSADVKNVTVTNSSNKPEKFEFSQGNQQSSIIVLFSDDDAIVGRDKERLFTIEYTSQDTASLYGQVLEVSVPKLANPEMVERYNVLVVVPESFGEPSIVEPNQYTLDILNGARILRFTDAGKTSGISVIFGKEQTYNIHLTYHIQNAGQNAGVVQVALPPDTPYQRVQFSAMNPLPQMVHQDADGNWIGEFTVAGQAIQDITVQGQVTVFAQPTVPVITTNPHAAQKTWWKTEPSVWLSSQNFWPTKHSNITALAAEQNTPRAIYSYVVDTLQYNYRRLQESGSTQRLGALGALQDPTNALCQEFTDLFITLARAANIPARRVTGYAVAQNAQLRPLSLVADVLHAWPEYYDAQRAQWVPVDPTWADTTGGVDYFSKLDLRHIAFAIQGQHDERPLPAGLYKLETAESKDILVELATVKLPTEPAPLKITPVPVLAAWLGVPTKVRFLVENPSGQARYNTNIQLAAKGPVQIVSESTISIPVLLPFEAKEVTMEVSGTNWVIADKAQLTFTVDSQTTTYDITARKAFQNPIFRWVLVGGSLALLSAAAGGISVFVIRRYGAVRRQGKKS